jgi:hypothetical protein
VAHVFFNAIWPLALNMDVEASVKLDAANAGRGEAEERLSSAGR